MKKYLPGLRIIKTAIAITFCALTANILSSFVGYNISFFYAGITVVFVMQKSEKESKEQIHARTMGTIIGGIVALFITFLRIEVFNNNLDLFFLFIGIVLIIQLLNLMNFKTGIVIATIMMLASFNDRDSTYFIYIIFRCLETLYGAYVAYFINKFFMPIKEKPSKI